MYLTDLTRNSFESGIPAPKWLALCKLLIAKIPPIQLESSGQVASNLSNSVLVLYRSYPGDPGLQDYLKTAIQDGILPVSTFVSTLLQAAHSAGLHIPATLDTLCRLALDVHFSSGKSPIGSIVPFNEPTSTTLNTVKDGLVLLRTAFSLPISHFHQLTTSVSELVILLLSCIGDMSQVSTTDALRLFAEVNELLTNYRLSRELRQDLDNFALSLSLLIGDDVKVAREAQMLHTAQFSLGKGDILGPSSETDIISLGLLLNYMIMDKAHDFGAGDSKNTVALLVATFRWSSWSLTVFFTQLLLSAFTCLSQSQGNSSRLWKAFVVGRLPILLNSFLDIVRADTSTNADSGGALLAGLTALFQRPDILSQVNSRDATTEVIPEEEIFRSFSREFLHQLVKYNLLTQQHANQLDPLVSNESSPKWHMEAHDLVLDLPAYMESKLIQDNGSDGDAHVWIDKITRDAGSHNAFASHVLKRFSTLATALDVDALGQLCRVLHTSEIIVDILALHIPISDLIFYSAMFLEDYDCETVGDPQTAVSHLGNIVLFIQYAISRFKLETVEMTRNSRTVSLRYLTNNDSMPRLCDRQPEEFSACQAWYKELFDKNSEGIEDNILRSMKPKVLLQATPLLFSQTINSCHTKKMDKEMLMNGISYFTGPLLNWTLVGIIKVLIRDIQQRAFIAPIHYEIIQLLVQSPSMPKCIIEICSPYFMILLSNKKRDPPNAPPSTFKIPALRQTIAHALNLKGDQLLAKFSGSGQIGYQQVQQAIQKAFVLARSHKPPFLDVRRCLNTLSPVKFLRVLWTEIVDAAALGELEACRRIATFVLTSPQGPCFPPLLPIFLHLELPLLIGMADMQQSPEQTITMELLVAIISSVLNAAVHLEFAMRSVATSGGGAGSVAGANAGGSGVSGNGNEGLVLGESSAAMARRLALDLRRNRTSDVSSMIVQRLSSSQSFVANFPAFMPIEGI